MKERPKNMKLITEDVKCDICVYREIQRKKYNSLKELYYKVLKENKELRIAICKLDTELMNCLHSKHGDGD